MKIFSRKKRLLLIIPMVVLILLGTIIRIAPLNALKIIGPVLVGSLVVLNKHQAYDTPFGLHPEVHSKAMDFIQEARDGGINLRIIRGHRDFKTQLAFYAQGRTKPGAIITKARPGYSLHNYALAFDVVAYKNGKPDWEGTPWKKVGEIGKRYGFTWGGDWRNFVDRPHFQAQKLTILRLLIFG